MVNVTEQQIEQVRNIVHTLVEATEHFQTLIKSGDVTKSLYSFSAIVEGYQVIAGILVQFEDAALMDKKTQLDRNIGEIAQFFENGNVLKIDEIVQFSFLPSMKKVHQLINDKVSSEESGEILIGMFHSFRNPREFYPEERVTAMLNESERQQAKLLFFTSEDVEFEQRQVEADTFENGEWTRVTAAFPDVINNVGAGKRSQVERKLRRMLPFTSFHVGNKFTLPKRMLENKKYAGLLVPFVVCMSKEQIHQFLQTNPKSVFKALTGNRGEDIYFVTKKGQRYVVAEHTKEQIMSSAEFDRWLDRLVVKVKGSYIIQRFIQTRTKANEPFHFRAHMQKDGTGTWGLTHIYPRVGSKKSNLSNVVNEGRVDDFHEFMMREFDDNGPKYEQDILQLSIDVAQHLDKLYGFALDELGLDFAIDETGRYWMHEANNGPQTAFHEEKRAVNTIAYAKYIAENQIFYDEPIRKSESGLFQTSKSKLPFYDAQGKLSIGVLSVAEPAGDKEIQVLAETASQKELALYVFKPKDMDADQMMMRAVVYEQGQWTEKIAEYPDVLIDFIQLSGEPEAAWVYEELAEVPVLNPWNRHQPVKHELFELLRQQDTMQDCIPAMQTITQPRDITKALEEHQRVLIQRNDWLNAGQICIEKIPNGKYAYTGTKKTTEYNGVQLRNQLKDNFSDHGYLICEDPRTDFEGKPFVVHTDLAFETDGWSVVSMYAAVQLGETMEAQELLEAKYGEAAAGELCAELERISIRMATVLREKADEAILLLSLSFGVNEDQQWKVVGIAPNQVRGVHDMEAWADVIVRQAEQVIQTNKER